MMINATLTDPMTSLVEPAGGGGATPLLPLANLYDFHEFVDIVLSIVWFMLFLCFFTELAKCLRAFRYWLSNRGKK